jgi:hypothetical protein
VLPPARRRVADAGRPACCLPSGLSPSVPEFHRVNRPAGPPGWEASRTRVADCHRRFGISPTPEHACVLLSLSVCHGVVTGEERASRAPGPHPHHRHPSHGLIVCDLSPATRRTSTGVSVNNVANDHLPGYAALRAALPVPHLCPGHPDPYLARRDSDVRPRPPHQERSFATVLWDTPACRNQKVANGGLGYAWSATVSQPARNCRARRRVGRRTTVAPGATVASPASSRGRWIRGNVQT